MPFNSYQFIFVFLPATLGGFWLLAKLSSRTAALGWLILASACFYAYASPMSLAIIAPSILLDYLLATVLLRTDLSRERRRTIVFAAGVIANVLFLGYFKYKNFFLDTANTVLATHFELTKVILPLGISFLTFQKIAFLADVKSGQVASVRLLDFLLFTLFFPRTVAGPIVHYNEIMPQLVDTTPRSFNTNVAVGVCLFSIGLFKKCVIADSIAEFVPPAFDFDPSGPPLTLLTAWAGVLAYTFQLYFDFSGYSDMALGVARMFGVRLPMNFNSPFKATSIVEFWSRWHITLTRFLTDYIYTPVVLYLTRARLTKGKTILRGKRSSLAAIAALVALPTFVTMTISGFWHGAGWQFIVWGVLHSIYLTINQSWRILRPRFWPDQVSYERVMKPLGFTLTFGAVVIALVFFRASSVNSAFSILGAMAGLNGVIPYDIQLLRSLGININVFIEWLIKPFWWIIVLFIAVAWLPNSLDLLRRFQPAVDFPGNNREALTLEESPVRKSIPRPGATTKTSVVESFRNAWLVIGKSRSKGISLSPLTAATIALLCVLGAMTLNRGDAFIYWKF